MHSSSCNICININSTAMELNNQSIDDSIIFKPLNFQNYSRFDSVQLTNPGNPRKQREQSKKCRNILLVMTIVEFLLIVAICTVSGLFGDRVCQLLLSIEKDNTTDSKTNCLAKGITIVCAP